MMGRGAEGGCGAEERPGPVSRARSSSSFPAPQTRSSSVDLLSQARKALCERSPFASEDELSRVDTLPVALAKSLARHGDGRKRQLKKPPTGDHVKKSDDAVVPPIASVWDEAEEYFRSITSSDLELLSQTSMQSVDPCFLIPTLLPTANGVAASEETLSLPMEGLEDVEVHNNGAFELAEQEHEDMDIDECDNVHSIKEEDNAAANSVSTEEALVEWSAASLNWLLGCKQRAILVTERPNKKRKLLGCDAGLERVLRLPCEESLPLCDYCCNQAAGAGDVLCCKSCKATVHSKCYGVAKNEGGDWVCVRCKYFMDVGKSFCGDREMPCWLCTREGGAMKPVDEGGRSDKGEVRFVHLFCSLWSPELYVERIEMMEPIRNIEGISETRMKLGCSICKVKHGACVRCSLGACRTSFHPSCARAAKHKMEVWGKVGCDNVELRAFCGKHSDIQECYSPASQKSIVANGSALGAEDAYTSSPANNLMETDHNFLTRDSTVSHPDVTESHIKSGNEKHLHDGANGVEHRLNFPVLEQGKEVISPVDDIFSSSSKALLILKKLSEKGKVNIHDVESETGISSNTLLSAMQGDSSLLSSEMQFKLIRWFQKYACIGDSARDLKTSYSLCGREVENTAMRTVDDADAVFISDPDTVGVIVKSLPSQKRTKGNNPTWNGTEIATVPAGAFVLKESTKCSSVKTPLAHDNSIKEASALQFSIVDKDCNKKRVLGQLAGDNFPIVTSSSNEEFQHEKATPNIMENHEISSRDIGSDAHGQGVLGQEIVPSSDFVLHHADDFCRSLVIQGNADANVLTFGEYDIQRSNSFTFFAHPWILKRLIDSGYAVENLLAGREKILPCFKGSTSFGSRKHLYQPSDGLYKKSNDETTNVGKLLELLSKAKELGIIELSPNDELEGEILSLQDKLISTSFLLKSHYDTLISKVVIQIPAELDIFKKQRWDMIVVNRYLRELREAKKRGRKERRHREAQAILAAAAAGAASSRLTSLRKDSKDEDVVTREESKPKVNSIFPISESYPQQLQKEKPTKMGVPKMGSGKQSNSNALSCDICRRPETLMKPVFVCGGCKVAVHLGCYRKGNSPISSWYCEFCEHFRDSCSSGPCSLENSEKSTSLPRCGLCGMTNGSFRKSNDGNWVHAFCAEWILGPKFRRGQEQPVEGVDTVLRTREILSCCICLQNSGVCIKCCYGHCQTAFHPICARDVGQFLISKLIGGNYTHHKAYCGKHSQEQREKAEFHLGAEEIKTLRQSRAELEMLRLLCERIIKREKLKRELLVCSHDILAARRIYVVKTLFARNALISSGMSSESATTSINNTSYSGTVERSDDVTVDSSASGKRRIIPPLHIRLERIGEACVRTNPSSTHMMDDKPSFSGKQLPQRPAFYNKLSSDGNIGKRPPKSAKKRNTFQEPQRTPEPASFQNQQSSRGFVHSSYESVSKAQYMDSCKPPKPDG